MKAVRAIQASLVALCFAATASPVHAIAYDFDDGGFEVFSELTLPGVRLSVEPDFNFGQYGSGFYLGFDGWEFMSGAALELPYSDTTLTLDFDLPVSALQMDVAFTGSGAVESIVAVRLFAADDSELFWDFVLPPPFSGSTAERRFLYDSDSLVARAEVHYGFVFGDGRVGIDNLVFQPVPEPSTWALLASGFIATAAWVRRRRARETS